MEQARTLELEETKPDRTRQRRPRVDYASEIVRYWWSRRWFIVRTLGVALVLFIGLLMLVPKLYRAEATIMIVPPRFMPEQRPEPLSVNTARALLGSGELLEEMLVRIRQARAAVLAIGGQVEASDATTGPAVLLGREPEAIVAEFGSILRRQTGDNDEATSALAVYLTRLSPAELRALVSLDASDIEQMTVQDLGESLESEDIVEKKTATDVRFSPLLKLYAVSDSGAKAQLFANTWARLFERMYERLTTEKTTTQFESIRKQQQQNQEQLEQIQEEIVRFKEKANLELIQKQIDEASEDFAEFSRQLSLKRSALDAESGKLEELQRLAESMERNKTWVGRVDVALREAEQASSASLPFAAAATGRTSATATPLSLNVTAEQVASALDDDYPVTASGKGAEQVYSRIRTQATQSRDRLAAAILDLNEFYRQQPLQLMEKERDQIQRDYLDSLSKLRTGEVRLRVLRNSVRDFDRQLSQTQQLLTLNVGVPTEAIANQMAAGNREDVARLSRLEFQRQEINPEWQSLAEGKAALIQEMEMLESEVQGLAEDLPKKEEQLQKLQDRIYRVQLSEQFMKENLDRWQKTNQELFDLYVETNNSIASTARQVKLLDVEVSNLEGSTSRSKAVVESHQQLFNEAAARLANLESRQRAIQRQGDVLLQKLQDAQIAMSGEVSDVSVAASAVAPSRHFFPRRSVLTIVFAVFATSLLLGFLARSRYLELQQQGAA